jgi:hypothetical protein
MLPRAGRRVEVDEAPRGPAAQATVDGLPGTVALRQVAPGDAGVEDEQDAVEDPAMTLIGLCRHGLS